MDKQFKLTDRVSKDSIKSPIFKKWVKRILCIACILSLALQLTLCCLPMKASAVESYEYIIKAGTYEFNTVVDVSTNFEALLPFSFYNPMTSQTEQFIGIVVGENNYNHCIQFFSDSSVHPFVYYNPVPTDLISYYPNGWLSGNVPSITVTTDTQTYYEFYDWFVSSTNYNIVNSSDVYDFIGETRIFNDELTLFNTSDATWTEAFSFNFEVLGVGISDYITLQRTAQNTYTMSYAFDFDGSGGLTMIYRDSPPFDNGESEWLGGKVNRKVITFLSNPEDPEFQQWLLDNTTLFDNVNDAYQLGQQSGYNNGYEEGFANSLIGDSLSGPINALSQITLIEIQGTAITLGGVVMTAIALCLVLAFLKLYAGG